MTLCVVTLRCTSCMRTRLPLGELIVDGNHRVCIAMLNVCSSHQVPRSAGRSLPSFPQRRRFVLFRKPSVQACMRSYCTRKHQTEHYMFWRQACVEKHSSLLYAAAGSKNNACEVGLLAFLEHLHSKRDITSTVAPERLRRHLCRGSQD